MTDEFREVIEDLGEWDWSLIVDADGVHARKPIKHDGVLTYSTKDQPASRRRNSEFGLWSTDVVNRYVEQSDTDMDTGEAMSAVNEAVRKRNADMECPECGAAINSSMTSSTYDDPRTGTGRTVNICPECGEQIQIGDQTGGQLA